MPVDFETELKNFRYGGRWLPLYIISSTENAEQLLPELTKQKIIMDKKPTGKLQHLGIKIMKHQISQPDTLIL